MFAGMWSPKQLLGQPLRVEVHVVLAARDDVDRLKLALDGREALLRVEHHRAGRHRVRGDDGHRAVRVGDGQVLRVRRAEHVEAEVEVRAGRRDAVRARERLARDAHVGHDRAALLAEAGLVELGHVQAVDQRRHADHLADGHDAGAADSHHPERELRVAEEAQRVAQLDRGEWDVGCAVPLALLLRGDHRQERRAVALEAREVLVARRLVDLRLAPELGLDRDHAQAARLLAAVAAALADALVDVDLLRRLLDLAALALAALLRGALLVVDQDRDARLTSASSSCAAISSLRSRTSAIGESDTPL